MESFHFNEIITDRLLLRKPQSSDWEMISYLRSDQEVNAYVKRPSAETKEVALEFISKTSIGIDKHDIYYWVITEKEDNQMLGSICLWNFSNDRKTAEVGYDLSPKFQNRGIMNEALVAVLNYGFNELKLASIEAFTHRNNNSSIKLLERNSFVLNKKRIDNNNPANAIYELTV